MNRCTHEFITTYTSEHPPHAAMGSIPYVVVTCAYCGQVRTLTSQGDVTINLDIGKIKRKLHVEEDK